MSGSDYAEEKFLPAVHLLGGRSRVSARVSRRRGQREVSPDQDLDEFQDPRRSDGAGNAPSTLSSR